MEVEGFRTPVQIHHEPTLISQVRVVVRVRPFLPREISSKNGIPTACVSLLESQSSSDDVALLLLKDQFTSRNECFKLDAFFDQQDNNVSQVFEREVKPMIPGIFEGYNATVFAYGATGSGKTYTMQGSKDQPGLIPLAMSNILSMCKCTGSTIAVSYYEIYLDRCYDLLEPKEKEIMIWSDKDGQMHLKGLSQIEVVSMAEFQEIFSSAIQRRKIAHTRLNDVSSRSHGALVISVSTPMHDSAASVVTGKINLIDLAGNEDNKKTSNAGIRLQESAKINQSLFTLSNVIYALNNNKPRIPYRESKLTRILQDSLGGTSRALMIACLNPGEYQESVHTVSLAARSRHVSNFVHSGFKSTNLNVKVDMEAKLQAWLESKGKTKSALRGSVLARTPTSLTSTRKLNTTCLFSSEIKAIRDKGISNSKQRSPCIASRNLFNGGGHVDHSLEVLLHTTDESNEQKLSIPASENVSESKPSVRDEPFSNELEEKVDEINSSVCSTPIEEKVKDPQRVILSPVNTNIERSNCTASNPKTPNLSSIPYGVENAFQGFDTPLEKFSARSSRITNTFVQDYVELLNTASRDELLALQGIGPKIAEYIIELRETSPLKSLCDLEKIGFSSKQVRNMFGRAARGMLEKVVHEA